MDLLGDFGSWDLETVFWGSPGMSWWSLLKGEKADGGVATVLLGEIAIWDLIGTIVSGDALLVSFAFLLRYLGRTLSSQYDCHCCAV